MSHPDDNDRMSVLVTGASGYVGSRLIPSLLLQGHHVVAASHSESSLDDYPWRDDVEVRRFDIEDDALVASAVEGIDAVVYLVHSMDDEDFVAKDREAAQRVASACETAGVGRVVYVSGLVPDAEELSDHLRSRLEVEQVFLDSDVPATVLRAAMVIGAGSTSYELLRRLSERIPLVTPVPSWMRRRLQPIAVSDVMFLIRRALEGDAVDGHFDVGGDEVLSYPELLALFADVAGLTRVRFPVPWVPKAVVGRACSLISGLPANEVSALVESLSHDMVCREDSARRTFLGPDYEFTSMRESLERALAGDVVPGTETSGDPLAAAATDPA